MQFYENINAVQSAYLSKATSDQTQCPKQVVKINDKIVASSTGTKPFKHAMQCPVEVTGRVRKSDIVEGKIKDEAPIFVTSDTGDFLGGAKQLFVFVTPGLGEDSLKPTSIENDGFFSNAKVVTLKAGHNFAIQSTATTVDLYRSTIDGQLYEQSQLPEQDQDQCLTKYTAQVKAERNARIADTDSYIQVSDMTVQATAKAKRAALTDEQKEAIKTYRQALRDLPETEGFPFVSFPELPDCIAYECQQKIDSRNQQINQGGLQ